MTLLRERAKKEITSAYWLAALAVGLLLLIGLIGFMTRGPNLDSNGCISESADGRQLVTTVLLDFTDQPTQNFAEYSKRVATQAWAAARVHEKFQLLLLTDQEGSPVRKLVTVCKPDTATFSALLHTGQGRLEELRVKAERDLEGAFDAAFTTPELAQQGRRSPILAALKLLSKERGLEWSSQSRLIVVSDFLENSSTANMYESRPTFEKFSGTSAGRALISEIQLPGVELSTCEIDSTPRFNDATMADVRAFWHGLFESLAKRGTCYSSQCGNFGDSCAWPAH